MKPWSSASSPFELGLFGRLEGRLVDVVQAPLLADCDDDLLSLQIDDDVGGQRLRLKIDIQLLKSDVVKLYVCCLRINSVRIDDHRLSRR